MGEETLTSYINSYYSEQSLIKAFLYDDINTIYNIMIAKDFNYETIETCIKIAFKNRNINIIKFLLTPNIINKNNETEAYIRETIAKYACILNHLSLLKYISSLHIKYNSCQPFSKYTYSYLIYIATKHRNHEIIAYLLYLPDYDNEYNEITYDMFELYTPYNLIEEIKNIFIENDFRFPINKLRDVVFKEYNKRFTPEILPTVDANVHATV